MPGKLFISLFFLFFLGMGSLFFYLVARDAVTGLKSWTWTKTDCQILSSSVGEAIEKNRQSGNFSFDVKYRYQWSGQTFTSESFSSKQRFFADYSKAARMVERYPAGGNAVCYANPSNPSEAVLQRGSLLFPLFLLFPLIFVTIGAGGIFYTWRNSSSSPEKERPISGNAQAVKGQRALSGFFLIFLLAGSGTFYAVVLRPAIRIWNARDWPTVGCTVISSEVQSHNSDDGTTYSVNILYRYEIKGREYKSNRYDFMGGSSSGYGRKMEIVGRYPPRTLTVCYVDPTDPNNAVLYRGFSSSMWIGLVPLLFMGVGGGGIIYVRRQARDSAPSMGTANPMDGKDWRPPETAKTVKPPGGAPSRVFQSSPWQKLLGVILIAAFWNGIVSVFVYQVIKSWQSGRPEWFLTFFMVPFVLVGLALLGGIVYFFLAMFNPRPRVTVTPSAVALGQPLRVEWEFSGGSGRIQNLQLSLEGREEATYRRGTSTCTDKNVFVRISLAQSTHPEAIRKGNAHVTVPAHLMHSFAAANNKIIWSICIHGEIPRWPDVKEEFAVTVLPSPPKPI